MTIKTVSLKIQEKKVKQDHNEQINKNLILALKKMDTSYNTASIKYINEQSNYMMLEETSE